MSGYCNDCGNTMCICSELKEDAVNEAFFELARLKDEMKEAIMLIEAMIPYIETYNDEYSAYSESEKDMIIATRWLERNKK